MLPTSTDLTVQTKAKAPPGLDAVVVFITEGAKKIEAQTLSADDRAAATRLIKAGVVRGKAREVAFDLVESGKHFRRVYVVGLGSAGKLNAEALRQSAGAVMKAMKKHRITNAAISLPTLESIDKPTAADAIVSGILLAAFEFKEYRGAGKKEEDESGKTQALNVTLLSGDSNVRAAVERALVVCDGQNFARTIASRPGNEINPPALAKITQQLAREVGLRIRVLDEMEMAKLGMGGILALEHRPRPTKTAPLLVVGKAITFDTGGISIKPAEKMGEMIFDKCGAMAVLGLMYAVAKLKLPIPVVGILSSAENMPSSTAYRPGDILRMYNGVTVEVTNTDAEGRLVLGDALAWGIETYKPAAVVDLATLTGGCVVALGHTMAGVMTNNDALNDQLQEAADQAGENIWLLPLGKDQRELIKSDTADIVNSAGRWASPLQGGAFLSYFIPSDGSVPWAHLDIAGVADTDKDLPYYARGATGWGVRTLVEWVTRRAAKFE